MTKITEPPKDEPKSGGPRPWDSAEQYEQQARSFQRAAEHFIGRGQPAGEWCESQRLRMKLAAVIENSDWTEQRIKTLQHVLRVAEGPPDIGEQRWRSVQAVRTWGGSWKLLRRQASAETRRVCLHHLVGALEAFDAIFGLLRHELGSLAAKLDAYDANRDRPGAKSAERVLAELIVEGADALGFVVEPLEPSEAEVRRIERQLERDVCEQAHPPPRRTSHVMRKAQPRGQAAGRKVSLER